jgi:signal transduction histidine kinase
MPLADTLMIQDDKRLHSLRSLCLLDTPADPSFDRLAELAVAILKVPVALVTLVDADRQFFKSQVGLPDPWMTTRQTPLTHSFCQHVVAHAKPLVIEDARTHPLVYDNLAIIDLNVIAYAGIPLTTPDGHTIGSFCLIDHKPRQWTDYEIDVLTKLAESVMTEVELRAEMIERQQVEQEREALLTRITELEQLKSDMIRVAAHDLRTPLGVIMGYATLVRGDNLTSSQRDFIKEISNATHRMERMIRDILSLERIEAYASGHQEHVSLNALVQAAFDERLPQAEQKQQQYTVALPCDAVLVQGDAVQLREALENLIGNAIKYTPQEGHVSVRLMESGLFEVEDTGYGIPAEQQKSLFAPFFRARTQETYEIEGTGLGLHLVKRIIERHGGVMHFHSEHGKGSVFGFQLSPSPMLEVEIEAVL